MNTKSSAINTAAAQIQLEVVKQSAQGTAKPVSLLFIPGAYHGAWAFRDTLLPFFAARGFTSYAFSMRGHGKSEGSELLKKASFDDYLVDLKQVAAEIKGPVVFIGHSAGGMLAQRYLESERLAGVVFVATPMGADLKRSQISALKEHTWITLKVVLTGNPDHFYHDTQACRKVLFANDNSPETENAMKQISLQSEPPRLAKDLLVFKANSPLSPCPALVVSGGKDTTVSSETVSNQQKMYNAEVKTYAEKSHELLVTPGWKDVAGDIAQWLETHVCTQVPGATVG